MRGHLAGFISGWEMHWMEGEEEEEEANILKFMTVGATVDEWRCLV